MDQKSYNLFSNRKMDSTIVSEQQNMSSIFFTIG